MMPVSRMVAGQTRGEFRQLSRDGCFEARRDFIGAVAEALEEGVPAGEPKSVGAAQTKAGCRL